MQSSEFQLWRNLLGIFAFNVGTEGVNGYDPKLCCTAVTVHAGGGNKVWQVNRGHFLKEDNRRGINDTHTNRVPSGDLCKVSASQVFAFEGDVDVSPTKAQLQQVTAECVFTAPDKMCTGVSLYVSACVRVWLHCKKRVCYWGLSTLDRACCVINHYIRIIAPVCFCWQFTVCNRLGKSDS